MANTTLRGALLFGHRWVALATSAILVVASLSGVLLAFERPLARLVDPVANRVDPGSARRPVAEWLAVALAAHPGTTALSVRLPTEPSDPAVVLLTQGKNVHVDPYAGRVLATRARGQSFGERVNKVHATLLAGDAGHAIVAATTALLLFLVGSGLYLFWPKAGQWRKTLRVRVRGPGRRLAFDLHNVIGFATALSVTALAFSGAFMAFEGTLAPLVHRAFGGPSARTLVATRGEGPAVDADAALGAAAAVIPGADLTVLGLPAAGTPVAIYTVLARYPEDGSGSGRTRVEVTLAGGIARVVESSREQPLGVELVAAQRPIHTGEALGIGGVAIAVTTSLLLVSQAITGLLLWLARRKRAAGAT